MAAKYVPPSLGTASFSCPHCVALTHQFWFWVFAEPCEKNAPPFMPNASVMNSITADQTLSPQQKQSLIDRVQKILARQLVLEKLEDSVPVRQRAHNIFLSRCYTCNDTSVWIADQLLYPATVHQIEPNHDLPPEVKADFEEASKIVNLSPRGAAALLRLAIEKLCATLESKAKDLNDAIGLLVKKGLSIRVQQALDVVRVIGNNAVHPGKIDMKDDKAAASRLFELVNLIAEQMISQPKHVQVMFDSLPDTAKQQIEQRDTPKQ
jgi:hypothetical protein